MKLIGIDFSINYPGICITNHELTDFEWIAFINTKITKKLHKLFEDAMIAYPKLKFYFIEGKQKKTEFYYLTERNKIMNQSLVVSGVTQVIEEILQKNIIITNKAENWNIEYDPNFQCNTAIAIEGFSYGSAGNTLVDLAQATGMLKYSLQMSRLLNPEYFYVFSPSELKKAIGAKGNANKIDVFNSFLETTNENLRQSDLFKFITANKDEIFDGKKIESPIPDMIDATLGVLKLQSFLQ